MELYCIKFVLTLVSDLQDEVQDIDTQLKAKQEELHILNNYKVLFIAYNSLTIFNKLCRL